jgi:hypothetical protein
MQSRRGLRAAAHEANLFARLAPGRPDRSRAPGDGVSGPPSVRRRTRP